MHLFGYDMPRLHAALNDLPAALFVVTVLFDLGAWLTKRESLRAAALWTLWAGVIGGWAAVIAGELASDIIEHGDAIHDLMETHETLALTTMGVFTVVLAYKLWRRARLSPVEEYVLRGLSVVGLVLVVVTGTYGGRLVFEHAAGVDTTTMKAEIVDRQKGHHHEDGEAGAAAHPPAQGAARDSAHQAAHSH